MHAEDTQAVTQPKLSLSALGHGARGGGKLAWDLSDSDGSDVEGAPANQTEEVTKDAAHKGRQSSSATAGYAGKSSKGKGKKKVKYKRTPQAIPPLPPGFHGGADSGQSSSRQSDPISDLVERNVEASLARCIAHEQAGQAPDFEEMQMAMFLMADNMWAQQQGVGAADTSSLEKAQIAIQKCIEAARSAHVPGKSASV